MTVPQQRTVIPEAAERLSGIHKTRPVLNREDCGYRSRLSRSPSSGRASRGPVGLAGMTLVSIRTLRSAVDPGLRQFAQLLLITRRSFAAFARRPAPSHQIVLREVL